MADVSDRVVDKRVQERNLRRGALSKKDLESYLEGLADASANAETVPLPATTEGSGEG